jgi:hypothetical protein
MKETVDFNWPNEKKGVKPEIITCLCSSFEIQSMEINFHFFPHFYCLERNDRRLYADAAALMPRKGNRDRCALNTELSV